MNDCQREALNSLQGYPMMDAAFRDHIIYIYTKVPEDQRHRYDIFEIISKRNAEELARVECWLSKAAEILGLNAEQFAQKFDFKTLRTDDPEKLYDVLAEPLVAIDLDAQGFTSINKLDRYIPTCEGSKPTADFTAILGILKFAIEVKTVRLEKDVQELIRLQPKEHEKRIKSLRLSPVPKPSPWLEDFKKAIATRIGPATTQLESTRQYMEIDRTMLIFYYRPVRSSHFMSPASYKKALQCMKSKIDYLGCKVGFDKEPIISPPLPSGKYPFLK